jgi:(p)ppGpp synthase/HD superfamily hydrolase
MKRVKELAKERSKPIWQHYTANKPIKTRVSRKISTRKQKQHKKMYDNPMTNVFQRLKKKRSSSRVITNTKVRYKSTTLIEEMYKKLGKHRSTSREKIVLEVEEQIIEDRFGDVPALTIS